MKSRFLNHLIVQEDTDKQWVVYEDFQYWSELLGKLITVEKGFPTDFASIPRWLPLTFAFLGDTAHEPAVIHDWLYCKGFTTRKMADDILLEAMLATKEIGKFAAYQIWLGVRVGGWVAWNNWRKQDKTS